jgi:hypothetical protein
MKATVRHANKSSGNAVVFKPVELSRKKRIGGLSLLLRITTGSCIMVLQWK